MISEPRIKGILPEILAYSVQVDIRAHPEDRKTLEAQIPGERDLMIRRYLPSHSSSRTEPCLLRCLGAIINHPPFF